MQGSARWLLALVMVSAGLLIGLATRPLDAQQNVLVSKKAAAPPPMEPTISDAWKAAPPLTVKAVGGKNLPGGSTDVTLRSVHTGDTVYFLVQYKDPTQSFQRGPWVK